MKRIEILLEDSGRTRWVTSDDNLKFGDFVFVLDEMGGELGKVVAFYEKYLEDENLLKVRKATQEEIEKIERKRKREIAAFNFCLERIKARKLSMKLIKVKFFLNERKGMFYFTAEGRIDFRELVKDLAKEFKMRIEMRQIGVRDEAKMVGGIGVCGRPLCCRSFLKLFEPITLQKARNQNINVNPLKISGLCGRLMCCLNFEEEGGRIYADEEALVEDESLKED
ncbi:MAG: PSP1 domain-containing protein [Candidatus Aminicenantia bacterium]